MGSFFVFKKNSTNNVQETESVSIFRVKSLDINRETDYINNYNKKVAKIIILFHMSIEVMAQLVESCTSEREVGSSILDREGKLFFGWTKKR